METIGLCLNFIGALLLVIASILGGNIISKIINTIAGTYGTWDMEKLPDNLTRKFRRINTTSKILNVLGFALFILGFSLQLLSLKSS